jgi:hypothetical protein
MQAVDFRRLGLPQELVHMVREEVGLWPMGLEEAKVLRLELMAERTQMTESATHEGSFETYNLCDANTREVAVPDARVFSSYSSFICLRFPCAGKQMRSDILCFRV